MKTFITAVSLLILVFFANLWSCTKPNEIPKVEIVLPEEGTALAIGDTAFFTISLDDDGERVDLSIQLKDEDLIAEIPIKRFRDLAPGTVQEFPYFLDEKEYTNGKYFIKAIVSDGKAEDSDFLEIQLEVNERQECLYVFEEKGSQHVLSSFCQGSWEEIARFQQDISKAEFWTEAKLLMLQTVQHELIAVDPLSGEIRWTQSFVGSGDFFTVNHTSPELFFQASKDEFIRGYDINGNLDVSVKIPSGFDAMSISSTNEYVMSYEKSVVGSQYFMRLYSMSTSQLIRDRTFPFLNPSLMGGATELWMLNPGSSVSVLRCLDEALTQFPTCQSLDYGADKIQKSREDESFFILDENLLHIIAVDGNSDVVININTTPSGFSHTDTHVCLWFGPKVLTYQRSDRNLILNPATSGTVLTASYF